MNQVQKGQKMKLLLSLAAKTAGFKLKRSVTKVLFSHSDSLSFNFVILIF